MWGGGWGWDLIGFERARWYLIPPHLATGWGTSLGARAPNLVCEYISHTSTHTSSFGKTLFWGMGQEAGGKAEGRKKGIFLPKAWKINCI